MISFPLTDEELVPICLAGDRVAWDELIDRCHNRIYFIAVRCGLDASEREDVIQNAGMALQRSLHTLQDHSKFRPWLIELIRNECYMEIRRRDEDLAPESEIPERFDPGPTQDEAMMLVEQYQTVHKAIAALGDPCTSLLQMLYLEERPFAEAAAGLGCSPNGIGPTRNRCLEKLKRELRRSGLTGR